MPTLGTFVLLCGFAEYRMGTRRAAATAVVTQLAGVLGAAGPWRSSPDTAGSGPTRPPSRVTSGSRPGRWARRAPRPPPLLLPGGPGADRAVTYVVISFVYVGVLWDLEHLLAVAAGLALGSRLVRSPSAVRRAAGLAGWPARG